MEKIKEISRHFIFSEIISILFTLILCFFLIGKVPWWLFVFIIGTYIFYVSAWNLILTFIFYFINESLSKTISFIIIFILTCPLIYLLYKKNYYEGLSIDYYNYHNKYLIVYLIEHINNVIIWLCLILNQLLAKFYYLIWSKIRKA